MTSLPEDWELKRLSDCLEKLKSGKKAERGWSPQCLSHPSPDENVWGVLKTTSVQMGEFQPEYNKELPDTLEAKSGLEVNSGDFLVTTTGPRNRCGIVCHVKKTRKKLIFSGKILRFRVNESIVLPNWLMYLLMSPEYQSTLDKMKVGTSDSSVSIGNQQILDLEILVPPIGEQNKIVELLEEHLSRLDAALVDVKQAKIKAAQFRRSILQAAFSGHLSSRETVSRTSLTEDWVHVSIGNMCRSVTKIDPINLGRDSFKYVDIGSLEPSSSSLENIEAIPTTDAPGRARQLLAVGDSIFATVRPYMKKVAYISQEFDGEIASTGFCVLRPIEEQLHAKYLFYFLLSDDLLDQVLPLQRGVSYPAIRDNDLRNAFIPLPPITEQQRIVAILEDYFSRMEATTKIADDMEMQAAALRRSLLQAAFTGQLTKEVVSV
jgi:type I restriction enzyme S subunit